MRGDVGAVLDRIRGPGWRTSPAPAPEYDRTCAAFGFDPLFSADRFAEEEHEIAGARFRALSGGPLIVLPPAGDDPARWWLQFHDRAARVDGLDLGAARSTITIESDRPFGVSDPADASWATMTSIRDTGRHWRRRGRHAR